MVQVINLVFSMLHTLRQIKIKYLIAAMLPLPKDYWLTKKICNKNLNSIWAQALCLPIFYTIINCYNAYIPYYLYISGFFRTKFNKFKKSTWNEKFSMYNCLYRSWYLAQLPRKLWLSVIIKASFERYKN